MNVDRLMLVIRALEEAPHPERFTMKLYLHVDEAYYIDRPELKCAAKYEENWCGTPACALGHLAAREDLQNIMRIDAPTFSIRYREPDSDGYFEQAMCADTRLQEWFDLDKHDLMLLFDENGCGGAETPADAVKFIKHFIDTYPD